MDESKRMVALRTDPDGRARFHDIDLPLTQGTPASRLTDAAPAEALQWRRSPVGFESGFHCTSDVQWLVVLRGAMAIGLQDGSWRTFGPGEGFLSADVLPPGATFDPSLHGHRSRQVGDEPLETLFVRLPKAPHGC